MPRRIVFVNQATGYLTIDVINAFAYSFDEVAFIYGDIRVQDVEIHPKARGSKVAEKSRKSNSARFLKWFQASIQIFFLLATRYRKHEIFYFSVPPFAYFSSLMLRRKFSLLMWDVYPDALKLAGIGESSLIYKTWSRINTRLFRRAHRLYTTGEGQAKLMEKYAPPGKVEIINLWPGLRNASPVPKEINPFITEHNLKGKFVVEYSGNMGGTHNVEALMEVASLLQDEPDILFLLIGRGTKMEKIRLDSEQRGLFNIMMLPFQPDDVIRYSLAGADLSVVLVEDGAASVSVPSKIYNLLAVGSPLLTISPRESEVDRLIRKYNAGQNFSGDKLEEVADFIMEMKKSPSKLNEYKENALAASKDFTAENAGKFLKSYLSA